VSGSGALPARARAWQKAGMKPLFPVAAVGLVLALAPEGAQAQFGQGGAGRSAAPPPVAAPRPPPPALPGLQGRPRTGPAPAERSPADMNPNDALFDGIARGDIDTVRDAVQRGADLRARNALGLTPIDAAVDQGRPEITFFLLSVRGGAGMASQGPPPEALAPPGRTRREPPVRAEPAPRVAEAAPALPRGPTLPIRTDGGEPIPAIGFLGFDPRR
jgi:hypothetical protein